MISMKNKKVQKQKTLDNKVILVAKRNLEIRVIDIETGKSKYASFIVKGLTLDQIRDEIKRHLTEKYGMGTLVPSEEEKK